MDMSIKILLGKKVEDFVKNYPEFAKERGNKKFLFFCTHHLFKYLNITYEDMIDGLVDGSNDYGIDGIFVFSSGELIADDDDLKTRIERDDNVKIQLIQTSRNAGFGETAVLKIKDGIEEIFDLNTKLKGNKDYLQKGQLVRDIWARCFELSRVTIEIEILYITLSDTDAANAKVKKIENKIYKYFKTQGLKNIKVKYMGIPSLYKMITEESYDKELTFKEITPYAEPYNRKVTGYYGLTKVKDFLNFITNDNAELEERYFEGNVRDYYGPSKKVNQKIRETLNSDNKMNLWCLNNGLTIICDKSNQRGRILKLFNFHIVNGCQTAHVIYECKDILKDDDSSEIIIKVIQTTDAEISNDIIDATNSQTAVQSPLLHSNDLVQRSIEEHFLTHIKPPLYYERRMNYYKRRHKPSNKIVTMMKLFQVLYSIFSKKPSVARGRPSETFDKEYQAVFDVSFDYDAYLFSYTLYLKMLKINREEIKRSIKDESILFIIRKYGMFHIIRIAFSLLLNNDSKINLKDKKNIFVKNKKKLFSTLDKKKKMDNLYRESVKLLHKAITNFKKKNKDMLLNYNIMKNDSLDKHITKVLLKNIKTDFNK